MRGHLAAQIDPLGLNNMDPENARKMIIRSVTGDEKVKRMVIFNFSRRSESKIELFASGIF